MQLLLRAVVEDGTTVLLSSHAIADLATVCDFVIILSASRVHVADDLEYVLASHRLLVGPHDCVDAPPGAIIVSATHAERQTNLLVRVEEPIKDPMWRVVEPTLEEIVIAYLRGGSAAGHPPPVSSQGAVLVGERHIAGGAGPPR